MSDYRLTMALFYACGHGTWNDVCRQLERGASLEWRHPADGLSTFHHSVIRNNLDVAEKILKHREDAGFNNILLLNSEFIGTELVLHMACRQNNLALVDLILRWGGIVTMPNKKGESPLHVACEYQRHSVVDRLMEQHDFEVDILNHQLETALHNACLVGNVDIVRKLLEKNADVNAQHVSDTSPLLKAVANRHWKVVNLLLERPDLDIHVKDLITGYTALHHACRFREEDKMLTPEDVAQGPEASTASLDTSEQEPNFCHLYCLPVIKSLLQRGVEVNTVARDGSTPLYFACRNDDREVVQLLLQHGPKIHMKNSIDCMGYSEVFGRKYIVKMLKDHTKATD